MRKEFSVSSVLMLAGILVFGGGYAWAQAKGDMGTSSGTSSDTSKSKDSSAKKKSEKSTSSSSDMGSSDMSSQKSSGGRTGGGSENVKKVQEALKDKGQDPGPIDGVMGPKTKAAVKSYQSANNMKATGR